MFFPIDHCLQLLIYVKTKYGLHLLITYHLHTCIKSTLFVVELCYFGEQGCIDNIGGTNGKASARMTTHKQKQLNYDQVISLSKCLGSN
jgi:hypothetical protein